MLPGWPPDRNSAARLRRLKQELMRLSSFYLDFRHLDVQ
jgi:hypothetical protein